MKLEEFRIKEIEAALDETSDTFPLSISNYKWSKQLSRSNDLYWEHPQTKTLYCKYCMYRKGKGHDASLHY